MKALEKFQAEAYALMRIVVGFMFSFHGVQKIFGVLTDHQPAIGSQIWFGGLIELIGGVMVMLGLENPLGSLYLQWDHGCRLHPIPLENADGHPPAAHRQQRRNGPTLRLHFPVPGYAGWSQMVFGQKRLIRKPIKLHEYK